jgi:anti-sigma B factor antagonist
LGFSERTIAGVTVLDLEGRLTFTAGAELSRRIQALLMGGATQLVLNLEDVSYVDSAGLGAVVEAFTAVRQKAARLTLLSPTERTRHLLEITGLARIIETFDSQAAALASYENVDAILTWDAEGGGPSSSTSEPTSLSATGLGSPTRRQ